MQRKIEGIVIKEIRYKDTSKILTIYTRNNGKISAMARGAYKAKSQLMAGSQLFSHNEYQLNKGRNFYYLNQADVVESFYSIRENISRVMYGSYILELVDLSTMAEEDNENLFLLLEKGLSVLAKLDENFLEFILAYELKYISFLGYRPVLDRCTVCNKSKFNNFKFSIEQGGIICSQCFHKEPYCQYMDLDMYRAMRTLLYKPLDEIHTLEFPKGTTFKLHEIVVKYILNKIDRKRFNSLKMLKTMENMEEII